ncbi:MAG: YfcE family phosphodiesterase [Oscillospiraceae bacterium]|nr:YfcE family phosphodiesterase [Oscillospiraceae bacterium]
MTKLRIAVFSDTHGVTDPMTAAVRHFQPDVLIHLGDHDRDTGVLLNEFPEIPLYNVAGNCDFAPLAPNVRTVQLGPVKAFLTHGHLYHTDFGRVDSLVYAAQEAGASLALFGHTHIPMHEDIGGVKVVNPGTAGKGREPTWALLEIYGNGGIGVSIKKLEREY